MDMRRMILIGMIAACLLATTIVGCGKVEIPESTAVAQHVREEPITIIDSSGTEVEIPRPVERIVIAYPTIGEPIRLLGAWDKVVGRDFYTTDEVLFPGASELPCVVGPMGHYLINYEKVFELDPDLFLTMAMPIPGLETVRDKLEPEIPVVALNFENPATLAENMRKLGLILGKEKEADEYIDFYQRVVNGITEKTARIPEAEKPRMFFWPLNYDYASRYMTYGKSFSSALEAQVEIVGGINIAEDLPGAYPYVNPEWLAEQDIDVIIGHVSPMVIRGIFGYEVDDATVAQNTIDWIMNKDKDPVLAGSDAVKDRRVYLYQNELVGSPKFVVALAYMAKWCHPELFPDLDPREIHQEYLTRFMGIDYDLSKHGVLFYPEP